MPTRVSTVLGADTSFGASPQSATITAPGSGNSLTLRISISNGAAITGVTCGDGSSSLLITRDRTATGNGVIEIWLVRNITNSPTSLSVSWASGSAIAFCDYVQWSGDIEQHNAQEGNANGFTTGLIGPSLTSVASGVGAFGDVNMGAATFSGASGITIDPGTSSASHVLWSENLGAAGTYTVGGTPGTGQNVEVTAVLIQSAGGGGGDTLVVVGNPQRNRRTSGRRM